MKIFITSIDTQLGYHLTECLRQDHLLLQGFSLISGTRSQEKSSFMLHDSVQKTYDFSKQRDLTVKLALQSDVLIVDLRNDPAPQIQFILKVLKHYPSKKPIKLIGISNYSTWANTKTMEFAQNPQDKQALLEQTINKNHWQPAQITKTHYPLRVPHPMFVYNYCLEEQILQLKNVNKMVQPVILCAGLLYGKSGFDLRNHVESAVEGKEDWVLGLKNEKMIGEESVLPILHVDRLMQEVEAIVYGKNGEQKQAQVKEYTVLCEDTPKSIVKIVQTINELCGNTKQLNFVKNDNTKQDKPAIDTLKLPFPTIQNPSSSTQLANDLSARTTTSTRNSQSQGITQALTKVFIPEVKFAKEKGRLSMLMSVSFRAGEGRSEGKEKRSVRVKEQDDSYVGEANQEGNVDDTQVKVRESDFSSEKTWLQQAIQQFTQYFDCQFKRFLLPEQLVKQHQTIQKLPQSFMTRYLVIDRDLLTHELNILVEKGMIPQERIATPEEDKKEDKKKTSNNSKNQPIRQSATKEPYEMVFDELMVHVLGKYRLSHCVVCVKAELIAKLLDLLGEAGFGEHKDTKFISITSKEPNNTPSYTVNQNITKSIPILSDEFYQLYDIQNPQSQLQLQTQQITLDEEQINKSAYKSRKDIQPHKDSSDQAEELKINLLHQYLLDNLIVYLAEAKHNLKAKGKLTDGQKLEGKENIKLFAEELKQIRAREVKLACEEEQ